jgi:hypothetical protein
MESARQAGTRKSLAIRRRADGGGWTRLWPCTNLRVANATHIRVEGSHLVIGNERIRTVCNEQIQKSESLRDSLVMLNTKVESAQREVIKPGVTPKEIGLEDTARWARNEELSVWCGLYEWLPVSEEAIVAQPELCHKTYPRFRGWTLRRAFLEKFVKCLRSTSASARRWCPLCRPR